MTNKRVVGYARISTEDQSNFSIDGQIEQIVTFANKEGYELVRMFVDEGQSAANFNRKSWKELEKFLKDNHKTIDYLIVMKYDRFSRNMQESLNVINTLENKYNIKIVSIAEPIGLPPESPFYFQIRGTMLLQAHVERLVIKDRTIFGIRKAKNDGRHLTVAPFGYKNERDAGNRPIITIVPDEAVIIRKMFDMFLSGIGMTEIRRTVMPLGFRKRGNDAVYRILTNKLYIGLIKVGAYQGEQEKHVKGLQEPIIDNESFYKAQILLARPHKTQVQYNENAYLRSTIVCSVCFKTLTSCRSKGKNKHYWYYECNNAEHRKSFNAEKAHATFENILKELDFTDNQLSYLEVAVKEKLKKERESNLSRLPALLSKKQIAFNKKEKLEEKYLEGNLDDVTFRSWYDKLKTELQGIDSQIKTAQTKEFEYWNSFSERFSQLSNISEIFKSANIHAKQIFVEKGFGKFLEYDGEVYRTPYLNSLFVSKALILKRKGLLEYKKKGGNSENSHLVPPMGALPNTLMSILDWIGFVQSA